MWTPDSNHATARAGEIVTWKASYGYRRIARSPATGQAHHEIYEPEAAVVRRIFTDRAAGITVREICRRLNADGVASPTGKPTWGPPGHHGQHLYRRARPGIDAEPVHAAKC